MKDKFNSIWINALAEFGSDFDWISLELALADERNKFRCFPPAGDVFKAFESLSPQEVKVVICGQDTYHGLGQAHGLAFSVKSGVDWPPYLRNIIREYESDLDRSWPDDPFDGNGVLDRWVNQGVLLLNDVLTVREAEPGSHHHLNWQALTSDIFKVVCRLEQPIVFILWGKEAQKKASLIHLPQHAVLTAPHPSPLAAYRGFFGSKPFSQTNTWLAARGCQGIEW